MTCSETARKHTPRSAEDEGSKGCEACQLESCAGCRHEAAFLERLERACLLCQRARVEWEARRAEGIRAGQRHGMVWAMPRRVRDGFLLACLVSGAGAVSYGKTLAPRMPFQSRSVHISRRGGKCAIVRNIVNYHRVWIN